VLSSKGEENAGSSPEVGYQANQGSCRLTRSSSDAD